MYAETRKISLIEEVLKVNNEDTLTALEAMLKKSKKKIMRKHKPSIYDFVGILTSKETDAMKTAIAETSEIIYPDDWK